MDTVQGDILDQEIKKADYKKEFYRSLYNEKSSNLPEVWNSGDIADLSHKVTDRKEKKAILNKVILPHDIWHSKQYGTSEFKPQIYKTAYGNDFEDKYHHTLEINQEVANKENNMLRTKLSEYSNA